MSSKAKSFFILFLACSLLIGSFAFLALAEDKEPVKLGIVLPMSPPGAYTTGTKMYRAAQLAASKVNESGGILGGRKVELILADSRGMPEQGKAAVERLITKEKVVGIIGNYHSGVALAQMPILKRYHIPYICAEAWDDRVTSKGQEEVFRISITTSMYTQIAVDWMKAVGFEKVYLLHENTAYGEWLKGYFSEQLDATNIEYKNVMADPKTQDFTSTLLRIAQWEPDLLFGDVTGPASFSLLKQSKNTGLAPTPDTAYYGSITLLNAKEFWESAGENGKYTVVSRIALPPTVESEMAKEVQKKFKETYDRDMTPQAMEGYDAFMLMVEAMKDAGSTDADAVIHALENIKWDGVRGTYQFPYSSDNPVPEDVPDYMWHQFPDVTCYLLEYTEVGQAPTEAPVIWPPEWASDVVGSDYYIPVPEE